MADGSNWDTYSEPTKKGMGVWAKVLMGCCTAALLSLGGCVAMAYWATHSGKDAILGFASAKVSGMIEAPWSKMIEVAEAIKTDEGAMKLYDENHRLAAPFHSREAFLGQAKAWRAALSEMPPDPPSIDSLGSGKFEVSQQYKNKNKFLRVRYETPNKTWITLSWEDGELVGIDLH